MPAPASVPQEPRPSSVADRLLIGVFLGIVALSGLGVLAFIVFLAVRQDWLIFSLLAVTFATVAVIAVYLKWFRPDSLGDDLPADADRLPESVRHSWWLRAVEGLFLMWALALTAAAISLLLRTFWGSARPFLVGAVLCWAILIILINGWMPSKFTP
jgi:hypothetical protein